ncbi:probable serine/threonine-protein kinase SIS8 [Prosopis cineraria]|uniref:probable serine/threonine-protein kinase SIS8 n=1 Tax=Prosopis cineraria TaxID=364024 RepID=UPI00240FE59C|nr:probable serine/threonine-protein kinase SIS8 [Prosopis cineraria]
MSRMKHLLRKLHIGGGINEPHRLPDTRPVINASPVPNLSSSSSTLVSNTVGTVRPNESVADRTDIDGTGDLCGDKGADFNLLEEEFQLQLALAISASDTDVRKDPESAQIDAAKQMSLGCAASVTDTEALVQFQSLRYWNYNVIDHEEKVMDGFYDLYGFSSNLAERGKMPLLVDLQTASLSENVGCEVILVNRMVDIKLKQLEKKAFAVSKDCCLSEQGLVSSGLLQKLADIVVNRMGGPVGDPDEMLKKWSARSHELRDSLRTIVIPLGCLDVGLSRHRALLFKVMADRINVPCMLVKGSYYTGTDDGAVNLIRSDDGSEYIIDLMGAPGTLIPAEVPSNQLQNYSFAVTGCAEIAELPINAHLILDGGTGMLAVPSDIDRTSTVDRAQSEQLLNVDSQGTMGARNQGGINQTERVEHDLGNLLQSMHISCESTSHTEASSADKMQVKNLSEYFLSAAKNPEFAQKLRAVPLESGAFPSPGLFSDINKKNTGENIFYEQIHQLDGKIVVDAVQFDSSFEKALISSQGVTSHSDVRFYQSASWLAKQQELEQSDVMFADKVPANLLKMHKEQVLDSSLTKAAVSCKRQIEVDYDDANGIDNKVGVVFNCNQYGNDSAIQFKEADNRDSNLTDGKSEKVKSVLGEGAEWEILWEDLHIGERIGIGSYGEVYHADWKGTEVAVKKFLNQDFSGDVLAQFRSEVEIMLRLRHPNVVLFMGAITRPPHFSILTEFLPRGSLYRLLHRPNFELDEKRRLRMALDVAKGMNYLHTSHPPIVHRDLKSPNLLVDKHWVVKVCDFGLSRMKHHTFLSSKSSAGTPEWMAPEVLRNEPANEKCDVYSFGVILWELATARIPWKGLNPMQVVGAVGFQNRRLEIPEDVDPVVAQIIRDCWQMEPHLRPSFSQLMSRLRHLQHLVVKDRSSTQ